MKAILIVAVSTHLTALITTTSVTLAPRNAVSWKSIGRAPIFATGFRRTAGRIAVSDAYLNVLCKSASLA